MNARAQSVNKHAYYSLCPSEYGYYLHDLEKLSERLLDLQAVLPESFQVYYSVKANPNADVLRTIVERVKGGFDVSSIGEIRAILKAGAHSSKCLFVGPGKQPLEMRQAIELGVNHFAVESIAELYKLDEIARNLRIVVRALIRVNPEYQAKGVKMAMAGRATQFGIAQSQVEQAFEAARSLSNVKVCGIHVYVGTRILSAKDCLTNTKNAIALGHTLFSKGYPIEIIDVGGGMGVPYYDDEQEFDSNDFGSRLSALLSTLPRDFCKRVSFILETGRFVVGPVGEFVTRIEKITKTNTYNVVYVNASSSQCAIVRGGRFGTKKTLRVALVRKRTSSEQQSLHRVKILGNLTPDPDVFADDIELPSLEIGDFLVIKNTGAYGLVASPFMTDLVGPAPTYVYQGGRSWNQGLTVGEQSVHLSKVA